MASTSSFDISTGADLQEVDNAVNQATKEIQQRYDFKGSKCTLAFDRTKLTLTLVADDESRRVGTGRQVIGALDQRLHGAEQVATHQPRRYTSSPPSASMVMIE